MKVIFGSYAGFDSIDLEWMDYKLSITPSIGGRILSYAYRGIEMLYTVSCIVYLLTYISQKAFPKGGEAK